MTKQRLVKICDLTVEICLLAAVLLTPLVFDFTLASYNVMDLYKAVWFRLMVSLALLAFAARALLAGKISWRGNGLIFLSAALTAVSFFLSSLYSLHPQDSFWGGFLRQQGFYNFVNYLLFFILLILSVKSFSQIKRLALAAVFSASLASLYGLAQFFRLDPIAWSAATPERIFSSLGQPNFFGHFLALILPLSVYALIFSAKGCWLKFAALAAVILQLFCLAFSYSRAAWLGFAAAAVFLILFWLIAGGRKKIAWGIFGLLLVAAAAVVSLSLSGRLIFPARTERLSLSGRLVSAFNLSEGSNRMRYYYLKAGYEEFKGAAALRKIIGYGPETLVGVFIKYYRPDWGVYEAVESLPDRAHNWAFDRLLAFGLIGLMAAAFFYGLIIYRLAAYLKSQPELSAEAWLAVFLLAGLIAYFINNLLSFSLITLSVYLYLFLALTWLVINRQKPERELPLPLTAVSKILIWSALLAAAAVFIYTNNLNQIRAERSYIKALRAVKAGDCPAVSRQLEKTLDLSPRGSFYRENYLYLNLNCLLKLETAASRLELANKMILRINDFGDLNYYGLKENLGRTYTLFGLYFDKSYYARAEKIFNELIAAYPYFTSAYQDLAKQKMLEQDFAAARKIYEQAIEVLPPLDHPGLNLEHQSQIKSILTLLYEQAGQAASKQKDYAAAAEYFRLGLKLDPHRATLYKYLADDYYLKGDLGETVKLNLRGYMLNPADYHWPLALSLLYRDQRNLAEARRYLDQALKLAPNNAELKKYKEELK